MEGKELRIGNYIKHSELSDITEVIAVGKDYIHILFNNETLYESIKWFTPIPLTEEWLLKFGFEIDNGWFKIGYLKLLPIRDLYYRAIVPITKDIKYVHQLQNLYFALTGEELTIKS
ncbi:hypothetical protein CMU04_06490 [Elizabethkingia anophelis]|nr:hypothetical protein [Elizabethkingia anophelis]